MNRKILPFQITKLVSSMVLGLSLTGCMFAPGMHMNSKKLTPTPNQSGDVATPTIQPITGSLVLKQAKSAHIARQLAAKNFHPPTGFSTDLKAYQYHIGAHDILNIVVWNHPQATQFASGSGSMTTTSISSNLGTNITDNLATQDATQFIVSSEGTIYYPYVGEIQVSGLTVTEARDAIQKAMAEYIKNPVVTVSVAQYKSQHIDVIGAVKATSVFPITDTPLTLRQAISMAGGVNRCGPSSQASNSSENSGICADLQNIILRRADSEIAVDLESLKAPNGSSQNYILEGGDVVYVPDNNLSRIFILGAVNHPGPYNIGSHAMSLREAFGDAGGVSNTSDPTYTYVVRNYQGNPQIFELNARSPDSLNLAGLFMLKPQDVVFVSTSKLSDFNSVLSELTPTLATYAYITTLVNN